MTGQLDFSLSDRLARGLFASFLGLDPDSPIDVVSLQDFAGEFANMSCGAWLTSLARPDCFAIRPPKVVYLDAPPATAPDTVILVNDDPVVVHVSLA